MPTSRLTSLLVVVTLVAFVPLEVSAQHEHDDHDPADMYGTVEFATSCSPATHEHFDQGLLLLHHMMYDQALPHFEAAAELEPECAIAHWGVAMTQLNPIWAPTSESQTTIARGALERARAAAVGGDRERAYVEALGAYFDGDDSNHGERLRRWESAQRALHEAHPDDVDAAAFFALAHLSIAPADDRGVEYRLRGGELLEPLLTEHLDHPGLFHYLIHLYDYPALAERAADVADAYDDIAPNVPHALHMPSHIFVRIGDWPGTIEWNRRSADAALEQPHGDLTSWHHAHAVDYMVYGYLQQGDDANAREIVDETLNVDRYQPHFASAYALAAVPARYALEREDWAAAAALDPRPQADFPWDRFPQYEAISHFARGVGAARSGDAATADAARARLDELHEHTAAAGEAYWATLVDAQRLTVAAWIAHAEGRHDEALDLMRRAADIEDSVDKHPVTPSDVLPARELLGDMLTKSERYQDAVEAYNRALEISPNRYRSHLGAARAAMLLDDDAAARAHYEQLIDFASGERSGIDEARRFLAGR